MIVSDQQRRDSIGAYGSRICKTPVMDAVAREGMRFDRAYTPTGLCSPTRASFFTGTYPHAHRVLTNVTLHPVRQSLAPAQDRLTPLLRRAGYRLGYVGKWHVSEHDDPRAFGFDRYVSLGDYFDWRRANGWPMLKEFVDYSRQIAVRDPAPASVSQTAWLCDRAIEFIQEGAGNDSPLFLRLDFHGPHFPNVVPDPWFAMYDPAAIEPWTNAFDPLTDKPAVHRMKTLHWRTKDLPWTAWQRLIAAYWGEVSLIDHHVGRVLAALRSAGMADDTLVIWTTDHGDTLGAHGICNKDYSMYEEVYSVPMLLRWPSRIAAGASSDAFVMHFLDLHATLRDLAGAAADADSHGRSLLPLFAGDPPPADWRDAAYCEFHGSHMGLATMRLLRDERYSYVYNPNDIDELYDNLVDPAQLANLAVTGTHEGVLRTMRRRMVGAMRETEDHLYNEWTVDWLTADPGLVALAPGRKNSRW